MKRALIVLGSTLIGAFFFAGTASATTIYQQLLDSNGTVNLVQSVYTIIGQFTTDSNQHCFSTTNPGDIEFFQYNPTPNAGIESIIVSSSTNAMDIDAINPTATINGTSTSGNVFYHFPLTGNVTDPQCMTPNTVYYIMINSPFPSSYVVSGVPTPLMFGFITDGSSLSTSIIPGTPGFATIGVSTSTLYQTCYSNLSNATSSSFFSQFEQDFSLGLCQTGVFLFVPNTYAVGQFTNIPNQLSVRFPFSWFVGTGSAIIDTVTSTTTNNFPGYTIDLQSLGIGSTTPMGNILPKFTFLSTSTVSTYLDDSKREALLFMVSCGLWLGFIWGCYVTIRDYTWSPNV